MIRLDFKDQRLFKKNQQIFQINQKIRDFFMKNATFLQIQAYIYIEMLKMKKILFFTPPFFMGFQIDRP